MGDEDRLSRREAQIARLYADGCNYKEIARRLSIAPGTVRKHLNAIFRKLNIQSKLELARLIVKEQASGLRMSRFEGRRSDRHFEGKMQADPRVTKLLEQLSLEQYIEAFAANDIDFEVLMTLSDGDLRELGIQAIGHRKRLAAAIQDLGAQGAYVGGAAAPVPEVARPPPSPAPAERRHLTVMFVDLVGSTALSTRLDPEPMRDLLEHYQRSVAREVERFGGYVANIMGDGMLVYFGWPQAHEDEAERAVWAALRVAASANAISRPDGAPLAVRIGITSGLVVVGQGVGPGAAVVGDAPNLASRLQDLAKPDQIVASATTAALVGGVFDLGSLGRHPIKGFDHPVEVFEVRGPRAHSGRFEARVGGRPAAMVGRALELGLLEERWRQAIGGEGQVVLLTGEAGFGKSRILRALRDSAGVTPASRTTVHCSPYQSETALFPFAERLARSLTAGGAEETKAAKRAQLRDLLADVGCSSTGAFYALARLVSIALDDDPPPAPDAREEREATLEALADLVLGAPHQRPRLILIEDLHWIDPTSRDLVDRLVGLAQTLPVLLVMTARPEFAPSWPHGSHVTVLNLHRLDPDHAAQLVDRIAEPRRLSGEARDRIVARADGVPLFIEELTKSVLDSASSGAEAGADWPADQPAITIPATLHDILMARLDRIPAAKAVAQTAAVLGRQFDQRLLAAAASWPPERLEEGLDQLVRAGLILRRGRPPEASYLFKHTLIRDEAYQSLLMRDRRVIHGRVLRVLERVGHGSGGAGDAPAGAKEFSVLAWHATAAELWPEAARYRHLAGSAARALWAIDEAIGQFRHALQAFERAAAGDPAGGDERRDAVMATKLALCECLYFMGRFRESFDLLHAAEGELAAIVDARLRGRSRYWLARLMSRIGWRGPIERLAELAIADSLSCDDRETTANAYNVLCVQRFFAGLPDESVAAGRRAISFLEREGPSETLGFAYHYISIALLLAGRFDRALEAIEGVLGIAEAIDHPRLRCYGRAIRGWSLGLSGAYAEGLRSLDQASAIAPDGATRIFVTGYTGCVQLEAGALEGAVERLREAHEACLAFPSPQFASLFGASLADAMHRLDRSSDAEAVAQKALDLGRDAPFPYGVGLATRALARLAWARSDRAAAVDFLHQAAGVLSSAGATFELARTYSDLAAVTGEVDGGGVAAAPGYAEQAARLLQRLGLTAGRPRAGGVRLSGP